MHNNIMDRKMLKWAPFNSVVPLKKIKNDEIKKRDFIEPPILDDEQINDIENKLLNAYYLNNEITIKYYKSGHFFLLKSFIKKIDPINKKIYFINGNYLFFKQIIAILQ